MSTVVEQRIDLLLEADVAQIQLLVRNLELHGASAVALAFLETPLVDIARIAVDHAALAIGLVFFPVPLVSVPVGVSHFACATLGAGKPITFVIIASEADFRA